MRGIDTAYNYRGFTSHRELSRVAADLLGKFTVSTKVGYFPSGEPTGRAVHSLDPTRLRAAVEQSAEELGRAPDVVFLHNPELAISGHTVAQARDRLADACAVLADAVTAGTCGAWGIATWDPRPLVDVIAPSAPGIRPGALLLRAGLSVPDPILSADETLCRLLDVPWVRQWGMSPFGGSTADQAWHTANLQPFLAPDQDCTNAQAAFRLAYELPRVSRVAVGTCDPAHLRDLVAAVEVSASDAAIDRYRELISEPS